MGTTYTRSWYLPKYENTLFSSAFGWSAVLMFRNNTRETQCVPLFGYDREMTARRSHISKSVWDIRTAPKSIGRISAQNEGPCCKWGQKHRMFVKSHPCEIAVQSQLSFIASHGYSSESSSTPWSASFIPRPDHLAVVDHKPWCFLDIFNHCHAVVALGIPRRTLDSRWYPDEPPSRKLCYGPSSRNPIRHNVVKHPQRF